MELAFSLPLLLFFFMLLMQVGVVMVDQLAVTQAARSGARAAAVNPTKATAINAVRTSTTLQPERVTVVLKTTKVDGLVRVTVSYQSQIKLPFTSRVLMRPTVTSSAAMALE